MVSSVLVCLATVLVSCQLIDATIFSGGEREEVPQDLPVAEDRIFKGKKLLGKKKNLLSLFRQPQVYHTLSPIDSYPIWKVHKYKGFELRPVQVVDVPTPFDYSPAQPDFYQYPVRAPHTEYGVPEISGVVKPEEPVAIPEVHFQAPVRTFHHGGKLRSLLDLLRSHRLFSKLRNLKSWKQGVLFQNYAALPEVQDIPVKGFENLNLHVPELPNVGLPSHGSAVTAGPYVKVQVSSPVPVSYATPVYPQYAPQYEYQYPPQYSPPSQALPVHVPAPYYGAPPLYDSYGTPLPADAYSSAPSDQVLSFAVPEYQPQVPGNEKEYNVSNSTVNGAVQDGEEMGKFLLEEKGNEEEATTGVDQNNNNQQTQLIN